MQRPDELLVPLVNAPHQRAAIRRAVGAASEVTVLNVVTPLDQPLSEGRVLRVSEERRAQARDRARWLVETATERAEPPVTVTVAEGWPARTVADHAERRDVDRIVVGGRDRSTLSRVLFGRSVAAAIDDETDVPVTVINEPDREDHRTPSKAEKPQ